MPAAGQRRTRHPGPVIARPDAAPVIFNDFFADGKAQAGAVILAERSKDLKHLVGDFRRDARAGVLDFSDDFLPSRLKAQEITPPSGIMSTAL